MKTKKMLCIMPARAGSKRIPGKNTKDFLGKPMLSYPLEVALKSGLFDTVMVSTDSPETASLAKSLGAEVPFLRSEENSADFATTDAVIQEVLDKYQENGEDFEAFFCIYPTAVFLTETMLKDAAKLLEAHASVIPLVPFSYPPQRGMVINEEGTACYAQPEYKNARSQDLPKLYHDAGLFYACKKDAFLKYNTTETPDTAALILPETAVQDIDNPTDLEIARLKFRILNNLD
ncbi:MAG: pseudaminic acid cytidylyltransferase [Lachnospiraceae bacterium]|nr:pseudaminic acid cytidylyltransferase [Lachnospiraceae bacterium]